MTRSGATRNQILDEIVSRMVRKGQLEQYDLMEQLRTIADEASQLFPLRQAP